MRKHSGEPGWGIMSGSANHLSATVPREGKGMLYIQATILLIFSSLQKGAAFQIRRVLRNQKKDKTFAERGRGEKGRAKLVLFVPPVVRVLLSAAGCNIVGGLVNVSQFFSMKYRRDNKFLSFSSVLFLDSRKRGN